MAGRDPGELLTGDFNGNIRVWDLTVQGSAERLVIQLGEEGASASFNSDGSLLATGTWDSLAQIWDPQTGELQSTLEGHTDAVLATAFHPTKNQLATASNDSTVRIWDTRTGEELLVLEGHQPGDVGGIFNGVLDLAYSPDGGTLATAGADGTLRIWDSESGEQIGLIEESLGLASVTYSSDGRYLAYGTDAPQGAAVILDAQTLEERFTMDIGPRVMSMDFSPDGQYLATAGGDNSVRIWALDFDRNAADLIEDFEPFTDSTLTVRFNPDGSLLSTSNRIEVRLWDVSRLGSASDGSSIQQVFSLPGGVGTAFSPASDELVSVGLNNVLRFYETKTNNLLDLGRERLTRSWTITECQQYLHMSSCP